jgi:hypothetical protein
MAEVVARTNFLRRTEFFANDGRLCNVSSESHFARISSLNARLVLCIINVVTNRQRCGILTASCRYPLLLHSD